jgi:carbonic anhydrase
MTVAGYVHDRDGAYSSFPGERYLVAFDGASDPNTIRARLPEDVSIRVAGLLP